MPRKSLDISPARRQTVIHEAHLPEGFRGSLCGYKAEIAISLKTGPSVCRSVMNWGVCVNRSWVRGEAVTAWAAVDSILSVVRRSRYSPSPDGRGVAGNAAPAVLSEAE